MTAAELATSLQPVFDNWYNNLKKHLHAGSLSSSSTIYCQDTINLYETEEYLVLELAGKKKLSDFNGVSFSKKAKKLGTVNSLINGGTVINTKVDYNPRIKIATAGEIWVDLYVASHDAYNGKDKCMHLDNWKKGLAASPCIPVEVQANAGGLMLAESTVFRLEPPKLFLKKATMVLVISKQTDPIRLVHFLIERLNETFPKRDRFIGIFDDEMAQKNPIEQLHNKHIPVSQALEENANLIAQALGYKGGKANVSLDNHPPIDLLLEKENGTYDLLNIQTGIFSQQVTKGKKNKPNLSNYTTTLKKQWQHWHNQKQVLKAQTGLELANDLFLIGVVENSNHVYTQAINQVATQETGDIALVSLEGLKTLVELRMKNNAQ